MAQNFDKEMRQSRKQIEKISDMLVNKISIIERRQCHEEHKTQTKRVADEEAKAAEDNRKINGSRERETKA